MQTIHNILFVTRGLTRDVDALGQALHLSRHYHADMQVLVACPEFPDDQACYQDSYTRWLTQQLEASLEAAREASGVDAQACPVPVRVECGATPAVRIIRHVLTQGHDLVLKEAEPKDDGKGFAALDMALLRKCPCPVWLSRPLDKPWADVKVAVAIDPQSQEPEGQALALRLLQLARSLTDTCNAELTVISCWDYPAEEYLRGSPWVSTPDEELLEAVLEAQRRHRHHLDQTILQSGIGGDMQVEHVRGRPEQAIAQRTQERNIDLLVMGSLGRTGIPGFVIGNTAENLIQALRCSLLAIKPDGFISPVKAH
jgi:universal stress protein E